MESRPANVWYPVGKRQRRAVGALELPRRVDPLAYSTQEALDRFTFVTGEVLDIRAVCVSLVDADRRLVTSSYGLPASTALLLSHAFRKHLVGSRHRLVIADARRDPQLMGNPAVRDGTVRACVGMPIDSADGRPVGTLLAIDGKPRLWTVLQLDVLERLCGLIVSEMGFGDAVRRASQSDVNAIERTGDLGRW